MKLSNTKMTTSGLLIIHEI